MNYRHSYHAGMFADIFKHTLLSLLLQSFLQKTTAFCYIDTHAGIGMYDLHAAAAQKTREYTTGLLPLLKETTYPDLIKPYLNSIAALNGVTELTPALRYYPGSPVIAQHFLRPQDRLLLNELHPAEFNLLKTHFHRERRATVQCMDAYQTLKAKLPPPTRRGLVFIDPAYEQIDEYTAILQGLTAGLARWATGVYAVWYPIKDPTTSNNFLRKLKKLAPAELLVAEIMLHSTAIRTALNGCGLAIINPPWQLAEKFNTLLPWLWQILSPAKQGGYRVDLLA